MHHMIKIYTYIMQKADGFFVANIKNIAVLKRHLVLVKNEPTFLYSQVL